MQLAIAPATSAKQRGESHNPAVYRRSCCTAALVKLYVNLCRMEMSNQCLVQTSAKPHRLHVSYFFQIPPTFFPAKVHLRELIGQKEKGRALAGHKQVEVGNPQVKHSQRGLLSTSAIPPSICPLSIIIAALLVEEFPNRSPSSPRLSGP